MQSNLHGSQNMIPDAMSDRMGMITVMKEKCSACGSAPQMKSVRITDFEGTTVEQHPWRCPNPKCLYHDPRNLDFDWLVPA